MACCWAPSASAPSAARSTAAACSSDWAPRPLVRAGLPRLCALRLGHGHQHLALDDRRRPAARRRLLGAGAVAVQRLGAARRRRAGWWAGRCRSTRRPPSAAWRWAAGSGASLPRSTGRPSRWSSPASHARRRRARPALRPAPAHSLPTSTRSTAAQVPQVELDLEPRSGPIVDRDRPTSSVPRTSPAFLDRDGRTASASARRDGARQLDAAARPRPSRALDRELRAPPTWTDYVRHNLRLTKADAEISERIRALHTGAEPPRVRRMIERPPNWFAAVSGVKDTTGPS